MKQNQARTRSAAIFIIVLLSVVTFIKIKPGHDPTPEFIVGQARRYNYTLLTQEAAVPGKIVLAIKDGKVLGSYRCTSQDAVVAWIYDSERESSDKREHSGISAAGFIGKVTDEKNQEFPIRCLQIGHLIRLRIPRGFAIKPQGIAITVLDGYYSQTSIPRQKTIVLSQFAEPKRFTRPPINAEVSSADKILRAECYVLPSGASNTTIVPVQPAWSEVLAKHESWSAEVISTAYCPEGPDEPDISHYGNQTDAIKVRINRFRYRDSLSYLTYRNARIMTVDGVRMLQLPTTQRVGKLQDAPATIERSQLPRSKKTLHQLSSGYLLIKLQRHSHKMEQAVGAASFVSLTPTIDDLGLDILHIRIGGNSVGVDLVPKGQKRSVQISVIPELKIAINISTSYKFASDTLIIPVHTHILHDKSPSRVPRAPTLGTSQLQKSISLDLPESPS